MGWENVRERSSQFLELYVHAQVKKLLHPGNILSMLISWHEGQQLESTVLSFFIQEDFASLSLWCRCNRFINFWRGNCNSVKQVTAGCLWQSPPLRKIDPHCWGLGLPLFPNSRVDSFFFTGDQIPHAGYIAMTGLSLMSLTWTTCRRRKACTCADDFCLPNVQFKSDSDYAINIKATV